jgi:hypothetical protein
MVLRRVASYVMPLGAALAAFLEAHAVGALIDRTTEPAAAIAPFAEARAATTQRDAVDADVVFRWTDADEALRARAIFDAIRTGDRIWLSCHGTLCEARVLARPGARRGVSMDLDGPGLTPL